MSGERVPDRGGRFVPASDIPRAATVRFGNSSDGGTLYVLLCAEDGAVQAIAAMDREQFAGLLGSGTDLLQAVAHGGLAIMAPEGRA